MNRTSMNKRHVKYERQMRAVLHGRKRGKIKPWWVRKESDGSKTKMVHVIIKDKEKTIEGCFFKTIGKKHWTMDWIAG